MTPAFTAVTYVAAALAEIAGCFAMWSWLRSGASGLWLVPGLASLALFAFLLTLVPVEKKVAVVTTSLLVVTVSIRSRRVTAMI